jgi:hypothetical protein
MRDLPGVSLSEGVIATILQRAGERAAPVAETIKAQVIAGEVMRSDETSARVKGHNWWQWVFLSEPGISHTIVPTRSFAEITAVMGQLVVKVWVCDCYGAQLKAPAKPGAVERVDYEYHRQGTRNLFMICEPQVGWRHVAVTEQRTMIDFAQQMKWLVDGKYPEATVIRIVMDNLNTHEPASLYEAFEPGAAHLEEVGVSPYAQAWQLVEYGRDRVECLESSMSGSSDPGCSNTEARSQGS